MFRASGGAPDRLLGHPLRRESTSGTLLAMFQALDSKPVESGVFSLGPMDGQEQPIDSDTHELRVVMTDGQQHRYLRSTRVQRMPDGRSAVVFGWAGRYYGPT
jgi:hypothetical protein